MNLTKTDKKKDNLTSRCKKCLKEIMANYYIKNKESINKRNNLYNDNNREEKNAKSRTYYRKNKEEILNKAIEYYNKNKVRLNKIQTIRNIEKRNTIDGKLKYTARAEVYKAISRGDINKPEKCESCSGVGRIEAHHFNYNNPLKIKWLCTTCHGLIHSIS